MGATDIYDAVIIGGGPAGLSAALFLARSRKSVIVIERDQFGGQLNSAAEVRNYPGIERASGRELSSVMRRQAEAAGAVMLYAEATAITDMDGIREVKTSAGPVRGIGVIVATGTRFEPIGFEGEAELRGRGVAYCVSCEGDFFTDCDVFAVGSSEELAVESASLAKFARSVTVLCPDRQIDCTPEELSALKSDPKIKILCGKRVVSVAGDGMLSEITYQDVVCGERTTVRADEGELMGVFIFSGSVPASELLSGIASRDEMMRVSTSADCMTSVEGICAAGDVRRKPLRQVVTAAADGATAATSIEAYVDAYKASHSVDTAAPSAPHASSEIGGGTPDERAAAADGAFFDADARAQLAPLFERMESPIVLELCLDDSDKSAELRGYIEELASLTEKLTVDIPRDHGESELPCVRVCREGGERTGLAFHGVPGGHEFTSFVLGIYNASGSGQQIDPDDAARIASIKKKLRLQIMVTLSCAICPETVTAAQKIASMSPLVSAEVYDLALFPELKERYSLLSVPAIAANGELAAFGKKSVRQLLDLFVDHH